MDGDEEDEIKRLEKLEKYLGCAYSRINPDKKDFDVFDKIGDKRSCSDKSNKKLIKNWLKNQLKNL